MSDSMFEPGSTVIMTGKLLIGPCGGVHESLEWIRRCTDCPRVPWFAALEADLASARADLNRPGKVFADADYVEGLVRDLADARKKIADKDYAIRAIGEDVRKAKAEAERVCKAGWEVVNDRTAKHAPTRRVDLGKLSDLRVALVEKGAK